MEELGKKYYAQVMQFRFLMLFPVVQSPLTHHHISLQSPKEAPYFYDLDIDVQVLDTLQLSFENINIEIRPQIFDEHVYVFECLYNLPSPERTESLLLNRTVQSRLKEYLLNKFNLNKNSISEKFTVLLVEEKGIKPDVYIDKHASMFAAFIRDMYEKLLDKQKIKDILLPRVRYSEHDLVVLDWNGAVIITDDGDVQSDMDMLKIGNYQLLRYRMLDELLDQKLDFLGRSLKRSRTSALINSNSLLREIVKERLSVILTLEKMDTSVLLIGDWYSSHMYRVIYEEFYINRWKNLVQDKLDHLKSLHETVNDNLALSWRRIIDQVTFIGWFVMMIGYFILFYIDINGR